MLLDNQAADLVQGLFTCRAKRMKAEASSVRDILPMFQPQFDAHGSAENKAAR
jgi:hypothetical protein